MKESEKNRGVDFVSYYCVANNSLFRQLLLILTFVFSALGLFMGVVIVVVVFVIYLSAGNNAKVFFCRAWPSIFYFTGVLVGVVSGLYVRETGVLEYVWWGGFFFMIAELFTAFSWKKLSDYCD